MATKQNRIVLNGKIYDAVTGDIIHHQPAAKTKSPKVQKKNRRHGKSIDGVVARKSKKAPKKAAASHSHKQAHKSNRSHHQPTHASAHKPKKAATLMRHSVSKPAHHKKDDKSEHTNVHDEHTARRLERAQSVSKSHHISRFGGHNTSSHQSHRSVPKKHADVPVEKPPEHHSSSNVSHHHVAKAQAQPLSASEKLVSNALKNARAHENKPLAKTPKRRMSHRLGFQRRFAQVATAGVAVLVLAGFFVYQNIPNLSLRLASTRAGFEAQQPNYQPAGFSQDQFVTYAPGRVTISFNSNTDNREYQLTQQVSNWNSQALADNYLAKSSKQYQTFQANGKTVYIYDDSSATWVNGGIWYQIEGNSSLNSDQLLRIANSI